MGEKAESVQTTHSELYLALSSRNANKLYRWLFFGVMLGVIPLICDYLLQRLHPAPEIKFGMSSVMEKGELLLICGAIAGGSIGELIGSNKDYMALKIATGAICVFVMFLTVTIYTDTASKVRALTSNKTVISSVNKPQESNANKPVNANVNKSVSPAANNSAASIANNSETIKENSSYDKDYLVTLSWVLFITSIITGMTSIIVSED